MNQTNRIDDFCAFLSDYENYIRNVLVPEHLKVKTFFEEWRETGYWAGYSRGTTYPSPIRAIFTRIKRPEKVVDKIMKKPREYPDGLKPDSFHKMHDCIGVRIIVYFLSQLPYIDRELRTSEHIEMSDQLPPEAYLGQGLVNRFGLTHIQRKEKDSGYSSLHYVARLKNSHSDHHPWFEVQVRTLAQELWSEMEHILAYKSEKSTNFSVKRRFQILSREISAIDEHFNLLYEELIDSQETMEHGKNDPLSPENLPYSLSLIGLRCAQQDFGTIIAILKSRGINTIKDFIQAAPPRRLETIKSTYISKLGRPPDNLELIAAIGAIHGSSPNRDDEKQQGEQKGEKKDETHQVVASHIEYSKFWHKFREEIMAKNQVNQNNPLSYNT